MDDCYFKSEILVHSNLEHEKNGTQLFGSKKTLFTAISSQKNCFAAICRKKNVDPSYLEVEKTC